MTRTTGFDPEDFDDNEHDFAMQRPGSESSGREAPEDPALSELLMSYQVPAPSDDFVEETLLRRLLQHHEVPVPSDDFVEDTLRRRAMESHEVPAASASFVDSVMVALQAERRSSGVAAGAPPPLEFAEGRSGRRRAASYWIAASLLAAALVLALLPTPRPGRERFGPYGVLQAAQASALFEEHLQPERFATQATNPLARTASLAWEEEHPTTRGRLRIAVPRTFATADRAALQPGLLPFALGFELDENE